MKSGAEPGAGAAQEVSQETEPDQQTPARLLAMTSRLLNQTSAHAQRLVGEGLANADARKYHYALLAALDEFGPASQSSLSGRTGIYRSDIVATINELTDRGFVDRAPDPADRRRNVITMTPAKPQQIIVYRLRQQPHLVAIGVDAQRAVAFGQLGAI